jgi:hypothetical protein
MRRTIIAASLGTTAALGGGALMLNVIGSSAGAVSVTAAADTTTDPSVPTLGAETAPDAAATATPRPLSDAVAKAIAGLVTDKTLTQAQADAVTKALQAARPAGGLGHGGRHLGVGPKLDTAATALGVTADELRTALRAGKSIAEVAGEKGVAVDKVIAALVTANEARLAQAVTDGKLTQAQADARKADLKARITDMVNGKFPLGGRRGHHGTVGISATPATAASGLASA